MVMIDYLLQETTQNRFSFKTIKNVDFINGKISTVNIPGNEDMIPWFKQMKNTDISALEFLNFKSKILDKYIPYLTELSKSKPSIGLGYSGELKDMEGLLEFLIRVLL